MYKALMYIAHLENLNMQLKMTPTCDLCLNSQSERLFFNVTCVFDGTFESSHVNNLPTLESISRPLYRQCKDFVKKRSDQVQHLALLDFVKLHFMRIL